MALLRGGRSLSERCTRDLFKPIIETFISPHIGHSTLLAMEVGRFGRLAAINFRNSLRSPVAIRHLHHDWVGIDSLSLCARHRWFDEMTLSCRLWFFGQQWLSGFLVFNWCLSTSPADLSRGDKLDRGRSWEQVSRLLPTKDDFRSLSLGSLALEVGDLSFHFAIRLDLESCLLAFNLISDVIVLGDQVCRIAKLPFIVILEIGLYYCLFQDCEAYVSSVGIRRLLFSQRFQINRVNLLVIYIQVRVRALFR